jgi:hypothetical protein
MRWAKGTMVFFSIGMRRDDRFEISSRFKVFDAYLKISSSKTQ